MKTIILLTCLFVCTLSFSQAIPVSQNIPSVKIGEPEFAGNASYVFDSTRTIPLEKQKAQVKAKAGVSVYITAVGKTKGFNVVERSRSTVRIASGVKVRFIARVLNNSIDPLKVINIFKLTQDEKKNQRVLVVGTHSTFGGSKTEIEFLPFTAKKYGTSSYLIEIDFLPAGEYAMTFDGSREVFNMFGVD